MKVFIIESELFVRRMFEEILGKRGHEVMAFENDQDCLHFFKDFGPDVLLLDNSSLTKPFSESIDEFLAISQIPVVATIFPQKNRLLTQEEKKKVCEVWEKPLEVVKLVTKFEEVLKNYGSR